LSGYELPNGGRLYGRLESYSLKLAGEDKRNYQTLNTQIMNEIASSPKPVAAGSFPEETVFGDLSQPPARRTLIDIIAALGTSYGDYDFGQFREDQFRREPQDVMYSTVATTLTAALPDFDAVFGRRLWATIEEEIEPVDCEVYVFLPGSEDNPLVEGRDAAWCLNYLLYNKKRRRMLVFAVYQSRDVGGSEALLASRQIPSMQSLGSYAMGGCDENDEHDENEYPLPEGDDLRCLDD